MRSRRPRRSPGSACSRDGIVVGGAQTVRRLRASTPSMRRVVFALGLALALTIASAAGARVATGTPRADRLVGTVRADTIRGLAGADTLVGLGGPDYLEGGPGRDVLDAGAGNDRVAISY